MSGSVLPDVDVCVVGSANLDVVATVERLPGPGETLLGDDYHEFAGGKGLNQVIAAARSGARTAFIGSVGHDAAGTVLRRVLDDDHVDTTHLTIADTATGRAVIFVDADGENVIVVVPGANATVAAPQTVGTPRVVLAQLEIPLGAVIGAFERARAAGAVTLLNPAPAASLPHDLLQLTDIVVPNEHEIGLLGGVDRLVDGGIGTVIVTRGRDGVDVHTPDDQWHQPPFRVDVVDTTGAGDAFCGALAARLASGGSLRDSVAWASAAGALATTSAGAVPAQPRARDIEQLLTSTPD